METERRQLVLDAMYQAQQYFFDTAEVEAWLSEQELHMMNEEKGKVCVCLNAEKRMHFSRLFKNHSAYMKLYMQYVTSH